MDSTDRWQLRNEIPVLSLSCEFCSPEQRDWCQTAFQYLEKRFLRVFVSSCEMNK